VLRKCALLLLLLLGSLGGCATVWDGSNQIISVETRSGERKIPEARCVLTNDFGKSRVRTPDTVSVHYSYSDLKIRCEKPGFEPQEAILASALKPKILGNALIGGVIGLGLDFVSGSAYEYPSRISVDMGEMLPILNPLSESTYSRVRTKFVAMQYAMTEDETRTVGLVQRTSCNPMSRPSLVKQELGVSQYITYCQDGRTARTVCQQSECRFAVLDDWRLQQ